MVVILNIISSMIIISVVIIMIIFISSVSIKSTNNIKKLYPTSENTRKVFL